jgi:long-chain acyl-CoA synthetase
MARVTADIAARQGDAVALVDDHGQSTWTELDARANRAIHALRTAGLQPGDTVALMVGNRREFFEATIAAMHSGYVVVPVNWHWVAEELAYVIDNSDAKALIVEGCYADVAVAATAGDRTPRCSTRIAVAEDPPPGFRSYEDLLAESSADEPADQVGGGPMFYTSGTTGFPKGVRNSLSNIGADAGFLGALATGLLSMMRLPLDGVVLLEGPAYHSAQWVFSVAPLAAGNTVVMRQRFDAAEMLRLIDTWGVTTMHLVPTQFSRLLKLSDGVRGGFDGTSLVSVIHGAAPCPVEVKRAMLEWWGPVLTEYYGGTEGGLLTLITGDEWLQRPGSVGKATAGTELRIIGADGEACGPNERGAIYFRSLFGADFEYHKAPDKTAAAHREPGVGTLGDIGYLDDDGYLFLSDRSIDMIISGGVNIYPAEIEAVLLGHPAVADGAVFGIPDDEMGEQVKAAVELVEGYKPSDDLAAELIAHVREHLAGYKAPRTIDFEPHLPRHPTGKLYKRLLRDPYWEGTGRLI